MIGLEICRISTPRAHYVDPLEEAGRDDELLSVVLRGMVPPSFSLVRSAGRGSCRRIMVSLYYSLINSNSVLIVN